VSSRRLRTAAIALAAIALLALVVFAVSRLDLHRVGDALIGATPGWIVLALLLMAASMFFRAISWQQILEAALPDIRIPGMPVLRATMIGVLASALIPGRVGEATRVVVLARRLEGSSRRLIAVIAGTVFSQTLINLLALAILLVVTLTSVQLPSGGTTGIALALAVPLLICLLILFGPKLMTIAAAARWARIALAAKTLERLLRLARQGLAAFARPRHGIPAILSQLFAWALQWMSCYAVLLALDLQTEAGLSAAAAVLLAVNLSAILPPTPSNVGVFQAACLVVLTAYGVGAGSALAYGIILQAIEVLTALLLGVPALLGEGLALKDLRSTAERSAEAELAASEASAEEATGAERAASAEAIERSGDEGA
jgi:phosphatidylinositol alpha-mannosyltransferase